MRSLYQKSMKRTLVFTPHVSFGSWPARTRCCLHGLCIWVMATRHHDKSSTPCPRSILQQPPQDTAGWAPSVCRCRDLWKQTVKIIPSWQFSSSIRSASDMQGLDALYFYFFFIFQCRTLCFLNLGSSPANSHQLSSVMWLPFSPAPWSWEHKSQVITLICATSAQTYKIHISSGGKEPCQSREISLRHIPLMPSINPATFQ